MPTMTRARAAIAACAAVAALGVAVTTGAPATAQTKTTTKSTASTGSSLVTATRPGTVVLVARGFGSAELNKDSDGDPRIEGRIDGIRYFIYFFGCTDGKNCSDIQFAAAFTPNKKATLKLMNDWNNKFRYGQAWLDDEGDANIAIPVEMDGGITRTNLEEWFKRWESVLGDYTDHIDFS
jgi:Putative bacterial sensory transduction regulator